MRLTLGVRDMDILRSFYRTLGWPELPNGDNSWTGFLLGGVLLHHLVPRSVLESDIVLGSPSALSAGKPMSQGAAWRRQCVGQDPKASRLND